MSGKSLSRQAKFCHGIDAGNIDSESMSYACCYFPLNLPHAYAGMTEKNFRK